TRATPPQPFPYEASTGFAPGPHLHYEFKIGGQHQDPMRVALPKADPLAARYIAQFKATAAAQGMQLALMRDIIPSRFE
ncbi:MAG: hypothetical protein ACK46J_06915, partial [Burkholderiales bacterium]